MKVAKKTILSTLVIASIAGLTACGGGSSNSSSTPKPTPTPTKKYNIQSTNTKLDDIKPSTQLNLVNSTQSNLSLNSTSESPVYSFENNPLGDYLTISKNGLVKLHIEKNHNQFLHQKIIINALLDNKKVADITLDVSHRNLTFMVLDTKYQKDGGTAVYKSVDSLDITPGDADMIYIKNTSNQNLNLKDETDFGTFDRGFYVARMNKDWNLSGYQIAKDSFFPEPNFDFKFQLIRSETDDSNPNNKNGIDCYNHQIAPGKICRLRYISYPLDIAGPIEYDTSGNPVKSWAWMYTGGLNDYIPGRLIGLPGKYEPTSAGWLLWSESLQESATSSGIKGDYLKDKKGILHIDTDHNEIKTDLQITLNNHNIKHIELPAYDNNSQPTNMAIIDKLKSSSHYKDNTFEGLDIVYPNNYQELKHKLPVVILNHGAGGLDDVVGVRDDRFSKGQVAYKHSLMQQAEKIAQKGIIVLMPLIDNSQGQYAIISNYQSFVTHALINEVASGDILKIISNKNNDIQISPYFYHMTNLDLKDLFEHADPEQFGIIGLSSGAKASLQAASTKLTKSFKRHNLIKAVVALSDGYPAGGSHPHPDYNISDIPTLMVGGTLDTDHTPDIKFAFTQKRTQPKDIMIIEKKGWHQTSNEDINMNELNATFLSAYLNHSQVDYDKIYGSADGSIKDVCHKKRANDDFGQRINNSVITMDLDECNIRK